MPSDRHVDEIKDGLYMPGQTSRSWMWDVEVTVLCDAGGKSFLGTAGNREGLEAALYIHQSGREQVKLGVTGTRCVFGAAAHGESSQVAAKS